MEYLVSIGIGAFYSEADLLYQHQGKVYSLGVRNAYAIIKPNNNQVSLRQTEARKDASMQTVLSMYVTLLSVILAGILNMIFCKSAVMNFANKPMDGGKYLRDGKRLFGANKTWKGFFGMILFGILSQVIVGWLSRYSSSMEQLNLFYQVEPNTLRTNTVIGFWLGLAYVVFELPNSWLKRRLNIAPGRTAKDAAKWWFVVIDQIDSLFGCALVVASFVSISLGHYLAFVGLGGVTHIVINQLLYQLKLRRNRF